MFAVLFFTALTALCWGIYGPVLHHGAHDMGGGSLRPFICVGLAYFLIAVLVPLVLLRLRPEAGGWSSSGMIWSLVAGAAGAIGALGIIMAFKFHGKPIYVMPLVFGGAPVVNTFYTMVLSRNYRQAGPIFYAGLILVITGAVTVLLRKPGATGAAAGLFSDMTLADLIRVAVSIAVVAISWGVYGPVLHKGQMAMHGSRLRPLICVGLAYFVIAVLGAGALLQANLLGGEEGNFTVSGSIWSLAGGAAGAIGALGIIMAFTFGGKPVYVMPLVFGLAPVINTFTTMAVAKTWSQDPLFFAGLLLVAAGAVTVLVFSPKGGPHAAPPKKPVPAPAKT
jgi:hypothetical protein